MHELDPPPAHALPRHRRGKTPPAERHHHRCASGKGTAGDCLIHKRINNVRQPLRRRISTTSVGQWPWRLSQQASTPRPINAAEKRGQIGDILVIWPQARRALEQDAGGPSSAAHEAVTRQPSSTSAVVKRPRLGSLALAERSLEPAIGGTCRGMGDELPRFDRELKVGSNTLVPTADNGLSPGLVERLLHLDNREQLWVSGDGDGEAAKADLDGAHGGYHHTNYRSR
jgi:hypothetical protein